MADQVVSRVQQRRQGLRRIENSGARQVTFSKRRKGLFRKASELTTLCGAEVGILVNSPAGRPYTFGSPSIEAVFNRFLSINSDQPNQVLPNSPSCAMVNNINQQFMDLSSQLHAAGLRSVLLTDHIKRAANAAPECTWSEKIDELEFDELNRLFSTLCETKDRLVARQIQIYQGGSSFHAGNISLAQGSQVAGYNTIETNQTNLRPTEPRISCSFLPSLNTSQHFVLSSGVNNASRQPLQGLSFGPLGYNLGNQLNNATCYSSNTELLFDPNGFDQSQILAMNNPQIPYNFYSNPFHPNNPIEEINDGPGPAEPGTLASIPGPYISTPQAQSYWVNDYLSQNFVGGFGWFWIRCRRPSWF